MTGELCDRAHEVGRKKKGMAPGNKADTAKSDEAVKRCARTRCHSSASALIFPGRRRRRRRRRESRSRRRPASPRRDNLLVPRPAPHMPTAWGRDLRTLRARRSVSCYTSLVPLSNPVPLLRILLACVSSRVRGLEGFSV